MKKLIPILAFLLASCIATPRPQNDTLFMPVIGHIVPNDACGQSPVASQLAFLFITDPGQKRVNPHCDNRLVRAAQFRADDMVNRQYFSHITNGSLSPNEVARLYGCNLPDDYQLFDNQIESIALNQPDASSVWRDWKNSPGHRTHVLGEIDFFREQTSYGFATASSAWGTVYVVETTPGC